MINATTRPLLVQNLLIPINTREPVLWPHLPIQPWSPEDRHIEQLSDARASLSSAFLINLMMSVLLAFPGHMDLGGVFLVLCNKSILVHPLLWAFWPLPQCSAKAILTSLRGQFQQQIRTGSRSPLQNIKFWVLGECPHVNKSVSSLYSTPFKVQPLKFLSHTHFPVNPVISYSGLSATLSVNKLSPPTTEAIYFPWARLRPDSSYRSGWEMKGRYLGWTSIILQGGHLRRGFCMVFRQRDADLFQQKGGNYCYQPRGFRGIWEFSVLRCITQCPHPLLGSHPFAIRDLTWA